MPVEACLPSEVIKSSSDPSVVHVDAFLYDEDEEEVLVEEGKITRAICNVCSSTDTKMRGENRFDIVQRSSETKIIIPQNS